MLILIAIDQVVLPKITKQHLDQKVYAVTDFHTGIDNINPKGYPAVGKGNLIKGPLKWSRVGQTFDLIVYEVRYYFV